MKKYFRKNVFDEELFHKDIQSYDSLYVFSYSYAKIETPKYKDFMASLADDYRVYFAPHKTLVYSVGWKKELTPDQEKLKPGDWGYKVKEFDTGLSDIGCMLDGDDCSGVLLTNKTEDEVLSKFDEYEEFDFVIPPNDKPIETLVFREGEVLPLPPFSRAKELYPRLKKLGMPVELSGGLFRYILLTEQFVVCEVGKRVTEEAAKILVYTNP
ncbi:hypothetical protein MKW94_013432 [Papaver nudicaule]|uniref:Uncharacterized protein n=1 Tax=Papaver nudicaule TaxID=74823 RepID=A0AA42AUG6_PAPNU|nr:hypothetical protein [Papaver nudicaule]